MKNQPTNIRFDAKTLEKIQLAAEISGKKSADIMRHAMELGLRRLETVNYDIDSMLYSGVEAAEKQQSAAIQAKPQSSDRERKPDPTDQRGREPVKKPIRHSRSTNR